ncbi:MFS general substrate transporter [Meredithblackwellia eburnea MCA 4105]
MSPPTLDPIPSTTSVKDLQGPDSPDQVNKPREASQEPTRGDEHSKRDGAAEAAKQQQDEGFKPTRRFWLVMLAVMSCVLLAALDMTCVGLALPVIVKDLGRPDLSIWVASAYALTSTALVPWTASLASIFGRKPTMQGSIVIFVVGSTICGAAKSMPVMVLGRAVAGIGGGGILVLTQIIVVDLIPLAHRGPFFGLIGGVWALASTAGPPLSGALTTAGQYRWLFWMNLPIGAGALALVTIFMDLKAPKLTWKERMARMDWYNIIFVCGATSLVLGLSWAGSTYKWSSPAVIVPIILGLALIGIFIPVDQRSSHPTVPTVLFGHITSLIGFWEVFIHAIIFMAFAFFRASLYFQGAKGVTPLLSGVYSLPMSFIIAPFAIISGILVSKTGKYKYLNIASWVLTAAGLGLLSILTPTSPPVTWILYPILSCMGLGFLQTCTTFPIQAPLEPRMQPAAMGLLTFVRSFGNVLGLSIGGVVAQNYLTDNMPKAFVDVFPPGTDLTFVGVAYVNSVPLPLRNAVKRAFSDALARLFLVLVGVAGLGLIATLFMKDLVLTKKKDEDWGLREKQKKEAQGEVDIEKGESLGTLPEV